MKKITFKQQFFDVLIILKTNHWDVVTRLYLATVFSATTVGLHVFSTLASKSKIDLTCTMHNSEVAVRILKYSSFLLNASQFQVGCSMQVDLNAEMRVTCW